MACMTEVPYNPTDITRQRELLDAIHETYMQDFRASGILSRLVQFELDILADPKAFVRLEFKTKLIPYTGNTDWVEPTLLKMKACMDQDTMPPMDESIMGGECDFCAYARQRTELTLKHIQALKQQPKIQG